MLQQVFSEYVVIPAAKLKKFDSLLPGYGGRHRYKEVTMYEGTARFTVEFDYMDDHAAFFSAWNDIMNPEKYPHPTRWQRIKKLIRNLF